jgi:D-alanyl-D-alanine carboxypeptidase
MPNAQTGSIKNLEEWARAYGWKEYPFILASYAPNASKTRITRVDPSEIESKVRATAYVVMDKKTGTILSMKNEQLVWPIASLTKLMTTDIVLSKNPSLKQLFPVLTEDNVGGAKLAVKNGDTLSVDDLFYAMLVGSANNAANALSRTTGLSRDAFVEKMNARAVELGLTKTHFADPSGMELGNVSTPLELAQLVKVVFENPKAARYLGTSLKVVRVANTGETKKIKSTNWMLTYPEYDALYVTGGKTGYLEESKWNLASTIRPSATDKTRELLVVLFGADSRAQSFADTQTLVNWAWNVYEWK